MVQAQLTFDETPYKILDRAGRVTASGGTEHDVFLYQVGWTGNAWKIVGGRVLRH